MREVVQKRTRSGAGEDVFVTMTYCGPVLAIWGSEDGFLPPETNVEAIRQLRDDPLCQVAMVDAGHCPHDERPEQVESPYSRLKPYILIPNSDCPHDERPEQGDEYLHACLCACMHAYMPDESRACMHICMAIDS